eukprot:COSAG02_NODE_7637_length_2922_cov_6.155863_3_plen_414_part_01
MFLGGAECVFVCVVRHRTKRLRRRPRHAQPLLDLEPGMLRMLAAATLAVGASAVPLTAGSLSFGAEISLANAVDTNDLAPQFRSVLANAAGFAPESVQVVLDNTSARRSLQSGGAVLSIEYVISCGTSCDGVSASLAAMAEGGAQSEAFAASIIDAVNAAATASGFAGAVLSTPADVAATIRAPETVSIVLPPAPTPAPQDEDAPVEPSNVATCPDSGYINVGTPSVPSGGGTIGSACSFSSDCIEGGFCKFLAGVGTCYFCGSIADFGTPDDPTGCSNQGLSNIPECWAGCDPDYAAPAPPTPSVSSDFFDISTTGTEILDDQWANPLNTWNHDDGFVDVSLPFTFMWYQQEEPAVTIGTNGMLSFGTAHLRNGGSEPIPCVNLCGNNNYGSHANHADWGIDGVIAPYWADIN